MVQLGGIARDAVCTHSGNGLARHLVLRLVPVVALAVWICIHISASALALDIQNALGSLGIRRTSRARGDVGTRAHGCGLGGSIGGDPARDAGAFGRLALPLFITIRIWISFHCICILMILSLCRFQICLRVCCMSARLYTTCPCRIVRPSSRMLSAQQPVWKIECIRSILLLA